MPPRARCAARSPQVRNDLIDAANMSFAIDPEGTVIPFLTSKENEEPDRVAAAAAASGNHNAKDDSEYYEELNKVFEQRRVARENANANKKKLAVDKEQQVRRVRERQACERRVCERRAARVRATLHERSWLLS